MTQTKKEQDKNLQKYKQNLLLKIKNQETEKKIIDESIMKQNLFVMRQDNGIYISLPNTSSTTKRKK